MTTVVFTSPFVPAELIEAHGFQPSRIVSEGSASPAPCDSMAGMCPYVQAFVSDVCRDSDAGAVVLATTCDQMRRAAELIRRESPIPLFLMNVPATWQTPASRELYASELRRLGRFLVQLGGRSPSARDLAAAMRRFDDSRGELRAARGRLSARRYAEILAGFHRSGQIVPIEHEASASPKGIPIALVGGPLPLSDLWLFDEIARNGGRIVLDGSDNGERTLPAPFDRRRLEDDPVGVLADAYWGTIPDVFQRPNTRLYDWLGRAMRESGARGLIVRHYVWCDLWHAEVRRLAEWAAVPVLHIDVESGNLSGERMRTRLQAFMEMLR